MVKKENRKMKTKTARTKKRKGFLKGVNIEENDFKFGIFIKI
jgi:hypothetical protein